MINEHQAKLSIIMLVFFCTSMVLSSCNAKNETESSLNTADSFPVLSDDNNNEVANVEHEWQRIYAAVLNGDNPLEINYSEIEYRSNLEGYSEEVLRYFGYGLYDIDGNGIPELFVGLGLKERWSYDIYSIENGTAKYLIRSRAGNVEKSTGILFNYMFDNDTYYYDNGGLVSFDYFKQLYGETPEDILLGNGIIEDWYQSVHNNDIFEIETFESFSDAIEHYLANPVSYFSADLKEKLRQKSDPVTYWTAENLNLREAPNTDSKRIATVPKYAAVNVIDFMDGEWYQIEYKGQTGYMKAEYLSMAIDYGDDWQKAYEVVLNGYDPFGYKYSELTLEKNAFRDWENQKFFIGSGLHDFDDNGIPELFVFIQETFGQSSNIYTLKDGAIRFLISFPGRMVEKSTNILFCFEDFVEGHCNDEAYRYEDHKFVAIPDYAQTISEDNFLYDIRYYLGGKEYDWGSDPENSSKIEIFTNFSDAVNFYFYQKTLMAISP